MNRKRTYKYLISHTMGGKWIPSYSSIPPRYMVQALNRMKVRQYDQIVKIPGTKKSGHAVMFKNGIIWDTVNKIRSRGNIAMYKKLHRTYRREEE